MISEPAPDPEAKSQREIAAVTMLDQSIGKLTEHFDAVQIFVTFGSTNGTRRYEKGHGNYFARYGMVKLWCLTEEGEEWNQKVKD